VRDYCAVGFRVVMDVPSRSASADPATGREPISQWARIRVDEGVFHDLERGAKVVSVRPFEWGKIPQELQGARFLYSAGSERHTTSFTVEGSGTVLMAVTSSWTGGETDGDWVAECVSRNDLEAAGWTEVTRLRAGLLDWIVFRRDCVEGESFSYRTEKYLAPILIVKEGNAPGSLYQQ
jgi:hypothetical protein